MFDWIFVDFNDSRARLIVAKLKADRRRDDLLHRFEPTAGVPMKMPAKDFRHTGSMKLFEHRLSDFRFDVEIIFLFVRTLEKPRNVLKNDDSLGLTFVENFVEPFFMLIFQIGNLREISVELRIENDKMDRRAIKLEIIVAKMIDITFYRLSSRKISDVVISANANQRNFWVQFVENIFDVAFLSRTIRFFDSKRKQNSTMKVSFFASNKFFTIERVDDVAANNEKLRLWLEFVDFFD